MLYFHTFFLYFADTIQAIQVLSSILMMYYNITIYCQQEFEFMPYNHSSHLISSHDSPCVRSRFSHNDSITLLQIATSYTDKTIL